MITSKGDNLIFIISQPRSGSTLLQLILNTHVDISTTPEPWIALHPLYALKDKGLVSEYDSKIAHDALKEFFHYSGIDEVFYKKQLSQMLISLYNQALKSLGGQYFLDKTPRYYEIIEELSHLWPDARFIILLRNPLAILNSIVKTWLRGNLLELVSFKRDLLICPHKLIHFMQNSDARKIVIRYEDIVIEPSVTVKKICDFIGGISFHEDMLNYNANHQWQLGDKKVRNSTYPQKESLNKWEKDLQKDPQLAHFTLSYLKYLGEKNMEIMGYDYNELLATINKIDILPGDIDREFSWNQLMKEDEMITGIEKCDEYRFYINSYYRSSYEKEVIELSRDAKQLLDQLHSTSSQLSDVSSQLVDVKLKLNDEKHQKERTIERYESTLCRRLTTSIKKLLNIS